jgi:glycosyltransferase involved in cell wall biosynthesis
LQVTEQTGIKVPAVSPEQAIRDLATAIERLAGDANLRKQLARAARERVENTFVWDKKLDRLQEVYEN